MLETGQLLTFMCDCGGSVCDKRNGTFFIYLGERSGLRVYFFSLRENKICRYSRLDLKYFKKV